MIKVTRWTLMLCLMSLCLGGCGYQQQSLFPEDIKTVAVPIFQNRTFYRGVEFDLTEALIKEIELQTPYKAIKAPSAQTRIEGEIVNIRQNSLSHTREGGLVQEIELQIVVNFAWKHENDGPTICQNNGLVATGRYVVSSPIGEPLELAKHTAVQNLARKIVSAMRADW